MNTRRKLFKYSQLAMACLIAVGFLLAGCGQRAATPMAMELSKEVVKTVEVEMEAAALEKPAAPQEAPAAGGDSSSADKTANDYTYARPAMIIKDGTMDLLVADVDRAVDQVIALAQDQGGYVINSSTWVDTGYKYAEFRLGVPSVVFEQTMSALRRLGVQVLNETSSGQDVSAEYADLQTRLTNLEATAARVRAFLENAKTVEEALQVNATLSQLEGEIAQIKGLMKFYEGRAAYSTITVSLKPQRPTPTPTLTPTPTPTVTPTPRWNPGETFKDAADTSVKLMQGTVDVLIWLLVLFWWVLVLAGIGVFIWLRRRKARKAAKGNTP